MTVPTCPHCGGPLAPVAHHHHTAPWLCQPCGRGWWAAELTPAARASYRPTHHDFRPAKPVTQAVRREQVEAAQRGTSLRPEQVELVHPTQLIGLARLRLTTDMAALVVARMKGDA